MRLKDKVAIITGAGRGIGRATALHFAVEGACVVVADIEQDVAQTVTDEITAVSGKGVAVQVDVTNRNAVNEMVQTTLAQYGRIDILINNAGITRDAQLYKMDEDAFDQVVSVNLKGVFNCSQAVVPYMVQQGGGVILNASSVVVANAYLWLASDESSYVNGHTLAIDGGTVL